MKGKHINVALLKQQALSHKILCVIITLALMCLMIPAGLRAQATSTSNTESKVDALPTESEKEVVKTEPNDTKVDVPIENESNEVSITIKTLCTEQKAKFQYRSTESGDDWQTATRWAKFVNQSAATWDLSEDKKKICIFNKSGLQIDTIEFKAGIHTTLDDDQTLSKQDSSTVLVNLVVDDVELNYAPNGGVWSDGTELPKKVKSKFWNYIIFPIENPERELYEFQGWTDKFGVKVSGSQEITDEFLNTLEDNSTLKASWIGEEKTLVFHSDGGMWPDGSYTKETTQRLFEKVKLPNDKPTRSGYEFAKYYDDQTGEEITSNTIVTPELVGHSISTKWNKKFKAEFNSDDLDFKYQVDGQEAVVGTSYYYEWVGEGDEDTCWRVLEGDEGVRYEFTLYDKNGKSVHHVVFSAVDNTEIFIQEDPFYEYSYIVGVESKGTTLSGNIYTVGPDTSKKPLNKAKIKFSQDGKEDIVAYSDSEGNYSIPTKLDGEYDYTVTYPEGDVILIEDKYITNPYTESDELDIDASYKEVQSKFMHNRFPGDPDYDNIKQNLNYNFQVPAVHPKKDGYDFKGWQERGKGGIFIPVEITTMPLVTKASEYTFDANWERVDVSFTFSIEGDGHGNVTDDAGKEPKTIQRDSTVTEVGDNFIKVKEPVSDTQKVFTANVEDPIPGEKGESKFDGFFVKDSKGDMVPLEKDTIISKDLAVTAKFSLDTIKVKTAVAGEGKGELTESKTIQKGTHYIVKDNTITLTEPEGTEPIELVATAGKDSVFEGFFSKYDTEESEPFKGEGYIYKNILITAHFAIEKVNITLSGDTDKGHKNFHYVYTNPSGNIDSGDEIEFKDSLFVGTTYTMDKNGVLTCMFEHPKANGNIEKEVITPTATEGFVFDSLEINGETVKAGQTYRVNTNEEIVGKVNYKLIENPVTPSSDGSNATSGSSSTATGDVFSYAIIGFLMTGLVAFYILRKKSYC